MEQDIVQTKQSLLLDEYETLYNDYVANLSAARFQKAGETQKELDALESELYQNTLAISPSKSSGYTDLKQKLEKVPTAQAQQDHTKSQMDLSKRQYYLMGFAAIILVVFAIRAFLSAPSRRELLIIAAFIAILFFYMYYKTFIYDV